MPGGTTVQIGNVLLEQMLYLPSVTVPNVNAGADAQQSVTVRGGVQVGDMVSWNQLSYVAGLAVVNVYVSAKDTLQFQWANYTGSNITSTAAQPFELTIKRPDRTYTLLPANL